MYCKHCGQQIDDDSTFCKFCGKSQSAPKQSAKKCRVCGAELRNDYPDDICGTCKGVVECINKASKDEEGDRGEHAGRKCRKCGATLPDNYPFFICSVCNSAQQANTEEPTAPKPVKTESPFGRTKLHPQERNGCLQFFKYFAIFCVICVLIGIADRALNSNDSVDAGKAKDIASSPAMSLTDYYYIQPGMDQDHVFEVVGSSGKEAYGKGKNATIVWNINGKSDYALVVFRDGKVLSKEMRSPQSDTSTSPSGTSSTPAPSHSSTSSPSQSSSATTASNPPTISLSEYYNIETGMSYDEVVEIVGSYGVELSRVEVSGYQTVMVGWDGEGGIGANANVTFQNGKVIAKAQLGLQ